MKLLNIAREYAALSVVSAHTSSKILSVVHCFEKKTGVDEISDISIDTLAQYKIATLSSVRNVSYNGYLGYLRLVGEYAKKEGYWDTNLFKKLAMAPKERLQPKILSREDIIQAVAYLHAHQDSFQPVWFWIRVMRFLYLTGVRRRQLVQIRWSHVNLDKQLIHLHVDGSKTYREWFIPIADDLMEDIEEIRFRSTMALGRPIKNDDPLFNVCWFHGRYKKNESDPLLMRATSITDFFKRLYKHSGIRIGAHRFRHTIATELCNPTEGMADIYAVQELLGHTNIQTTRGYVQPDSAKIAKYVNNLEFPVNM